MFRIKLYPFYEMDGAIGGSPSVEGTAEAVSAETASVQETPDAEPAESTSESESSFAKRLREHSDKAIKAEREKWEKENGDKYKDYDLLKTTAEFFRERHGFQDLLSMKEEIELERLQARAEKEQVSPEVLRRIDELEAKAAKGDQLEQQIQEEQRVNQYKSVLGEFAKSKGIEADALNQFMIENQLTYDPNNMEKSFTIAYKAMAFDDVSTKVETAEKEGVKKFLQAKGAIPTVPGSAATGQVTSAPPKTFAEARARAMQRMTGEG